MSVFSFFFSPSSSRTIDVLEVRGVAGRWQVTGVQHLSFVQAPHAHLKVVQGQSASAVLNTVSSGKLKW